MYTSRLLCISSKDEVERLDVVGLKHGLNINAGIGRAGTSLSTLMRPSSDEFKIVEAHPATSNQIPNSLQYLFVYFSWKTHLKGDSFIEHWEDGLKALATALQATQSRASSATQETVKASGASEASLNSTLSPWETGAVHMRSIKLSGRSGTYVPTLMETTAHQSCVEDCCWRTHLYYPVAYRFRRSTCRTD